MWERGDPYIKSGCGNQRGEATNTWVKLPLQNTGYYPLCGVCLFPVLSFSSLIQGASLLSTDWAGLRIARGGFRAVRVQVAVGSLFNGVVIQPSRYCDHHDSLPTPAPGATYRHHELSPSLCSIKLSHLYHLGKPGTKPGPCPASGLGPGRARRNSWHLVTDMLLHAERCDVWRACAGPCPGPGLA